MKTAICVIVAIVAFSCVHAQDFHDWKAHFKIVDDSGQPLKGAAVTVFYDAMSQNTNVDLGKVMGLTDVDGVFTASHHNRTYGLRFLVEKDGYYSTDINDDFHGVFSQEKLNRNLNLTLKKIVKPIAMYGKSVNLGMPVFDKPAGFDLMMGDWVAPYGKGINADILFEAHLDQRPQNDADYRLTVSFPKTGDGIQEFVVPDMEKGSDLRSPHEAPVSGYQSQWVQTRNRKPGQPETGNLDANRNYIFRVRTALDQQGNVVSAHYGKIYGDFLQFRYYLNPTPNSRNIEFAPKQNLLGGIQSFEQVTAP